ncbi:Fur family transcriptional regulator, ferric uptake regulator [Daejeonella rubra]|uniref:Fur family transcriptional regulator, ferric uptake regulator n=1 Tax=Daejeonella rubra TaxID=990371 RepID=A0A1G9NLJ6_9SPHI|nr:transcriptional repressor [Daejeonella rubra]SDL87234.1 Fur family transcriptional regulator, ferric uptake regulator [Daejeonella rubra]
MTQRSPDMYQENKETKLISKGVKPTAMRLLVMDVLSNQEAAISLGQLEQSFEKVDRITLYRTLKTFENKNVIHSIDDGSGAIKYALCVEGCECHPEDLHVHFHCTKCKRTYCLPEIIIPAISLPKKFVSKQINMVIKGLCGKCTT